MPSVWAIADLHLSLGVKDKEMDVFGENWKNHHQKIENHWKQTISHEDLVLIPGDISWGMRLEEAKVDLDWIGNLPGTKVMIKGNHDLWWSSLSKIKKILHPSCHLIQNNAFNWNTISIGGTRLWDVPHLKFDSIINYKKNDRENSDQKFDHEESQKIYEREVSRLETSLKAMDPKAALKIVMVHYPPIGLDGQSNAVTDLLEKYRIDMCLFGHLHNVVKGNALFGKFRGIEYILTSCDYLDDFQPLKIFQLS